MDRAKSATDASIPLILDRMIIQVMVELQTWMLLLVARHLFLVRRALIHLFLVRIKASPCLLCLRLASSISAMIVAFGMTMGFVSEAAGQSNSLAQRTRRSAPS
mmetsp:Transcript_8308/g.26244  ORF Transcript_8308/g.26244 Transcript_8308/m.26244 type:complete len:104 (+) Transcript_8308:965-1276(+)